MAPPTLYHVPKSISSPIYQALLELKVVDNPVHVKTLSFDDLKSPEHLARNPMGTVPTFLDDDNSIQIWESGAVLTYLLEMFDHCYRLHPNPQKANPRNRARFLHLQQFIIATAYPFVATLYLHIITKPKEDQDPTYVSEGIATWRTKLAPVLVEALADNDYFMGDAISAIDLLAAKPFNNVQSLDLLDEFPTLKANFDRVNSRPTFAKAYSAAPTSPKKNVCKECRSITMVPSIEDTK